MKVTVLKRFKDKHSGEIHEPGDILTVSKKRFAEILEVDKLVEAVEDKPAEKPVEE